jgi:hypothetical protein
VNAPRRTKPLDLAERRRGLNERLRAEFIAGAEEQSRKSLRPGLTAEEHERVLRRQPGDLPQGRSET